MFKFKQGAVIRTFKKTEFNKKYNFSLIYASTDEAVNHIMKYSQQALNNPNDANAFMISNNQQQDLSLIHI